VLIYHPAFDAYHAVFRALFICEHSNGALELEKLRILDFYMLFPAELAAMRLPRQLAGSKRLAQSLANPYHGPVNARQTFVDLQGIQLAAVRTLAASRLVESERLALGQIARTSLPVPDAVRDRFPEALSRLGKFGAVLFDEIAHIPLTGVNGLKDRSGLMEHAYDVA
jgi:hypothetical protein